MLWKLEGFVCEPKVFLKISINILLCFLPLIHFKVYTVIWILADIHTVTILWICWVHIIKNLPCSFLLETCFHRCICCPETLNLSSLSAKIEVIEQCVTSALQIIGLAPVQILFQVEASRVPLSACAKHSTIRRWKTPRGRWLSAKSTNKKRVGGWNPIFAKWGKCKSFVTDSLWRGNY